MIILIIFLTIILGIVIWGSVTQWRFISKDKSLLKIPKIGVFMWYDDKIKKFSDNNYEINKKYCEKYGYSLIKSDKKRVVDRPLHFERYALIYEKLDDYEYVMWIDSDAHFYIDSPPLTNIINEYPNKLFILSGDWDAYDNDYINNTNDLKINSGAFIVKKDAKSKSILKDIYTNRKLWKNRITPWIDQGVIRLLYRDNINDFRNISVVIPYLVFQHFCTTIHGERQPLSDTIYNKYIKPYFNTFKLNKPFIIHNISNCGDDTRINESRDYLKTLNN